MITKTCTVSGKEFVITKDDMKFYEKMGVPEPTLCPEERQRRRLARENTRKFYYRNCDATGKKILSIYNVNAQFPVYEKDYWWSDKWSAFDYGRDVDFSRSFYDQFWKLEQSVPKMSLLIDNNQNSDFVNQSGWDKNCYMCSCTDHSEDCSFGYDVYHSNSCFDCALLYESELCYECINCKKCYSSAFLQNCDSCVDSFFLRDSVGCKNCFGSVNLKHKQYYFLNKPYVKEEYEKKVESVGLNRGSFQQELAKNFLEFSIKFPKRSFVGIGNENSSGDLLNHSKSSHMCFESRELENCKHCFNVRGARDCYDMNRWGSFAELCYEVSGVGEGAYKKLFSDKCWSGTNVFCSVEVVHSEDCFGCVGLKKAQYCILNKQYTKDEYFELKGKIIEHMKETGEWGEFFPISMSPFAYNETEAQEYYPLTKEEALAKGYKWKDEEPGAKYNGPRYNIPDDIKDVKDDILQAILTCEVTGKNYRIVKPELDFYRKMNLPIPRLCPDERHKRRMALRNPRKLWDRKCGECKCDIQTTYAPERPEKVLCEECYLKEVN